MAFIFAFRHCVTGLAFGGGDPTVAQGGEEDDNALSPEACYECKINGYPKKGRQRRSTNSTQGEPVDDTQVIQSSLIQLLHILSVCKGAIKAREIH